MAPTGGTHASSRIARRGRMFLPAGIRLVSRPKRGVQMAGVEALDFDSPDETRTPDKTRVDVARLGDTRAARFAFEPGWKWSECVKPVVGTDSCQVRHVGVV